MVKDDTGPAVSTRKRKAEEEHVQPLGAYCSVFFLSPPAPTPSPRL